MGVVPHKRIGVNWRGRVRGSFCGRIELRIEAMVCSCEKLVKGRSTGRSGYDRGGVNEFLGELSAWIIGRLGVLWRMRLRCL